MEFNKRKAFRIKPFEILYKFSKGFLFLLVAFILSALIGLVMLVLTLAFRIAALSILSQKQLRGNGLAATAMFFGLIGAFISAIVISAN